MMLLAIDIGNSNVVFGIAKQKKWLHQWRSATGTNRAAGEYATFLYDALLEANIRLNDIDKVVLSSVVPALTPVLATMITQLLGKEALILRANYYEQLPISVNNPLEVGTDLVANALAAHTRYADSACIVVDFGTALTFTTIDKTGKMLGVAIAPGLKTAMQSLFSNTAQLPEVALEMPASALGNNTPHAMQAGILIGYVGLVRHVVAHIKQELNTPVKVLGTGGLVHVLTPLKGLFDDLDQNLTLDGLRLFSTIV